MKMAFCKYRGTKDGGGCAAYTTTEYQSRSTRLFCTKQRNHEGKHVAYSSNKCQTAEGKGGGNMCCDGWNDGEPDGKCPDCGEDTLEGEATTGCNYSPVVCETCGASPCDLSC